MGRPYPVAASSAVELALVGPARSATVIATTTYATYLEVADADRTMLCVASAGAVRVPCALVLSPRAMPPQEPVGTPARIGGNHITVHSAAPIAFHVRRWWRPPAPTGLGKVPPARLTAAVRWLTGLVADPLDEGGRAAVTELVESATTRDLPDPAVARLLGRGPGLTPTGDDVLAGILVTLRALGSPAATSIARAVLAGTPATTPVSAGLLRHAVHGRCIPQLADVLTALGATATGDAASPADTGSGALPRAVGALLAVGHTSGAGLLHGVKVAVAIAHSRRARVARPSIPVPARPAAVPA